MSPLHSSDQVHQEEKAKLEAYKQKQLETLDTMQDDIYRKRYEQLLPTYKVKPIWARLLTWGIVFLIFYFLIGFEWVF